MGDWGMDDDDLRANPHRRRIRRPPGVPAPASLPRQRQRPRSDVFDDYLDELRERGEPDVRSISNGGARPWTRNPLEGPLLFIGTGYAGPYNAELQRQMLHIIEMWGGRLERGLTQRNPRRVSAATTWDKLWFDWPTHTPFGQIEEWHTLYTFQGRDERKALLARNRAAQALRDTFGNRIHVLVDSSR